MRIGELRTRLTAALARWYRPRELLIRTDGRVSYVVLSKNRQIAATGVAGFVLFLILVLGAGWLVTDHRLQNRADELATARVAYVELLAEVSQYSDEFAALARNMEANEAALLALIEGPTPDKVDVDAIEAQVAQSQLVRAEGLAGSAGLKQKLDLFATDLRSVVNRNEQLAANIALLQEQLAAAEAEKQAIFQSRDEIARRLDETEIKLGEADARGAALDETIRALEDELASVQAARDAERDAGSELRQQLAALQTRLNGALEQTSSVEQRLAETQRRLQGLKDQREILVQARDQLSNEVGRLQHRIANMELSQQTVVQRLAERTRSGTAEVEKIVTMTGVDVDSLLRKVTIGLSGLGGPFVPASERPPMSGVQMVLATVAPLDLEMSRWEKLQLVLRSLPLNAPLDSYSIGSSFGMRKDPLNGKLAMHQGLDFSAALESPVLATAPGTVVFAGRKGSYGRMVEIDHGFGIRTRYAHLKSILVEVGQAVGYRDKIGKLGNSGRSTGPHVHYEILVDGKPYDPMNFLKAGRYVFKG